MSRYRTERNTVSKEEIELEFSYDPASGLFTRVSGRCAGCEVSAKDADGYIWVKGRSFLLRGHVAAWIVSHGKFEKGTHIDHINRHRSDNRLCNLRQVSPHMNFFNGRHTGRGKWGIGVNLDRPNHRFFVRDYVGGKRRAVLITKNHNSARLVGHRLWGKSNLELLGI